MENLNENMNEAVPEIEGGHWNYFYVCSECHGYIKWKEKICPYCKRRINWNE